MTPEQVQRGMEHYRRASDMVAKHESLTTAIHLIGTPRSKGFCFSLWEEENGSWLLKFSNEHAVRLTPNEGARVLYKAEEAIERIREEYRQSIEKIEATP